jgi:gliding motility-associated-like protein
MKNNTLFKIEKQPDSVLLNSKGSACVLGLVIGLFTCQQAKAQFVNLGGVKVDNSTTVSIDMNYINTASGSFINDGNVHIFQNWKNDGLVSFSQSSEGTTLFRGIQQQQIEGKETSNLQNVVFDNLSDLTPFDLKTTIAVGNNSDFKNGIINALDPKDKGLMIFNEKAKHTNAGDQSFVDGKVQKYVDKTPAKTTDTIFQFPVGNDLFFRPSYYGLDTASQNAYATQYFHKNSNDLHSHESKETGIITINNQEYWEVTQIDGTDKIVLSLTLDRDTTPAEFFDKDSNTQLAIVRWDPRAGKWINEGGVLSDDITGEAYSNLLTHQVSGYGIFTMAIVEKSDPPPPGVIVYNAISPNDDGHNDAFLIEGIKNFPDNSVEIYNRWGVKVYEAKSYNESDNMFRGYSDGRGTVKRGDKLPTGTYFYILRYNNGEKGVEQSGYLYINNQ